MFVATAEELLTEPIPAPSWLGETVKVTYTSPRTKQTTVFTGLVVDTPERTGQEPIIAAYINGREQLLTRAATYVIADARRSDSDPSAHPTTLIFSQDNPSYNLQPAPMAIPAPR